MIALGVRWRGTLKLRRLEQGFAIAYLLQWLIFQGWRLLGDDFNPIWSLPLHICDIVSLLLPIALISQKRVLIAILYFWGIGLSLQAILTPDLGFGVLHLMFWIFWLHHTAIVGVALYMVIVHRFRPTRQDFGWAITAGLMYLAFILPINIAFDFNYGYLGQRNPSQPSLIDWLGPWPWRVGVMVALAWLVMALLLAPWEWMRRKSRSS